MSKAVLLSITVLSTIFLDCNAQTMAQDYKALSAIVGTWRQETKQGMLYETWIKVNDSTLSGIGYKVNGADTSVLERVALVLRENKIAYIPVTEQQNDKQPVMFSLVSVSNGLYTFENPAHDFPQRIIYNLPVGDSMHAWIEGNSKGKFSKSEYRFKKVR